MYSKRTDLFIPLKCTLRLVVYEIDQENNKRDSIAKEQEVYMGEVPMMTNMNIYY